ncbi:MAG: LpqB family beta-propeller domain-containing protein [Actinomycetota bacterium]|nr:LpqB family beta-propeller domain-containing protein [Actinomycetota bacterium]
MTSGRTAVGVCALAVTASLALSGCAGLATSSAVTAQQAISNDAIPTLYVQGLPPDPGESARDAVLGFLRAGASLDDDYGVARQYLTTQASTRWKPSGAASIITGESDLKVTALTARGATVTGMQQATRDATGHLDPVIPAARRTLDVSLMRIAGEWRISSLPADFKPWLSNEDLLRVYSPQKVYYPSAVSKILVPDVQWYPSAGLATALARAVLAPPPAWLRPVLRPASLSGVRLAINAVPVDPSTGVAGIDLTSPALTTDGATRTALWAAMSATLSAVPEVTRVDLTVAGNRLAAPNLPSNPIGAADLGYQISQPGSSGEILRSSDGLRWKLSNADTALRSPDQPVKPPTRLPVIGPKFYDFASNDSASRVAALSTDRRQLMLWLDRTQRAVPPFAGNLTRPSFTGNTVLVAGITGEPDPDRSQKAKGVWAVDTAARGARLRAVPLAAPWLGRSNVLALKVSFDGVRVAMVVRDARGITSVEVAGLLRNTGGTPIGLGAPRTLPTRLRTVQDVTWLDDGTLAVLGRGQIGQRPTSDAPRVAQVPLSGQQQDFSAPPGVREVLAPGTGPADLFVIDQRGDTWTRQGDSWARLEGVDDLTSPGT